VNVNYPKEQRKRKRKKVVSLNFAL
jgi:hypothetical protein